VVHVERFKAVYALHRAVTVTGIGCFVCTMHVEEMWNKILY